MGTWSSGLTRRQAKAVSSRGPVILRGCPGTGATDLLVRRFLRLIERGARPDEILVLASFSDSCDRLKRLVSSHQPTAADAAHINTPKGLCVRLLRENAVEAGVAPDFAMLDDVGRETLVGRLISETLEVGHREPMTSGLLRDFGDDVVREAVGFIHRHLRETGITPSKDLIAKVNDPAPFWEAFERCYSGLLTLSESSDDPMEKLIERVEGGLPQALEAAGMLMSPLDPFGFPWSSFHVLKKYARRFDVEYVSRPIEQAVSAARAALQDFLAACLDVVSSQNAALILRLASDLDERYSFEKARTGALDRADILSATLRMLDGHSSQTTHACQVRFRHVLVSGLHEMGRLERRMLETVADPSGLFAVCDWRHQLPGGGLSFDGKRTRSLVLQENVRCRPGIARFANQVLGKLFHEEPGVVWQDMLPTGDFRAKSVPDVEVVLLPAYREGYADHATRERWRTREADVIAQRILEMTGHLGGEPMRHTCADRVGEPVGLRDIAILLRSISDADVYRMALRIHGIESLADAETEPEGIRILPVDEARNLHSPVVFIADMFDCRPPKAGAFVFHPDWGLATQVSDPSVKRPELPLSYQENAERIQAESMAYEKHLLHVAVTRAEEHLVIVGTSDLSGEHTSSYREIQYWTGWLEKALELGPESSEGVIGCDGCELLLTLK